jgi:hypothetical protein
MFGSIRQASQRFYRQKPYLTTIDKYEIHVETPTILSIALVTNEIDPASGVCRGDILRDCRLTSFQATMWVYAKFMNATYRAYMSSTDDRNGRHALDRDTSASSSAETADTTLRATLPTGTHVLAIGAADLSLYDAMQGNINTYKYPSFLDGSVIVVHEYLNASAAYQLIIASTAHVTIDREELSLLSSVLPGTCAYSSDTLCAMWTNETHAEAEDEAEDSATPGSYV